MPDDFSPEPLMRSNFEQIEMLTQAKKVGRGPGFVVNPRWGRIGFTDPPPDQQSIAPESVSQFLVHQTILPLREVRNGWMTLKQFIGCETCPPKRWDVGLFPVVYGFGQLSPS